MATNIPGIAPPNAHYVDDTDYNSAADINQLTDDVYALATDFGFLIATELTIAAGSVTRAVNAGNYFTIDTQADDPSDDLDTIAGGDEALVIVIRPENDARTIVVKHNTGNILCPGGFDITLDDEEKALILVYDNGLAKWIVLSGGIKLANDPAPTLGADLNLDQFSLVLPTAEPTADDTAIGLIRTVTVDSNSTGIGCPLFIAADGNYDEAEADTNATAPCLALALETGTGSKKVLFWGLIRNDGWAWTTGPGEVSLIYLSETIGTLTQVPPVTEDSVTQPVGYAITDDTMFFQPSLLYVTHGA